MLVMATAAFAMTLQTPLDPRLDGQLRQLFPAATSFSAKNGTPPHFNTFANDNGKRDAGHSRQRARGEAAVDSAGDGLQAVARAGLKTRPYRFLHAQSA